MRRLVFALAFGAGMGAVMWRGLWAFGVMG